MKEKNTILDAIIKISTQATDKKTAVFTMPAIQKLAKPLSKKYSCGTEEAILLAIIFSKYFESGFSVDIKDISYHLDCKPVELLSYEPHIKSLLKKKIISLNYDRDILRKGPFSYRFKNDIIRSILNDTNISKGSSIDSNISLLAAIQELINQYTEKEINYYDLEEELLELIENYQHLTFAHKLQHLEVTFELKVFILYVITLYYKGDNGIDLRVVLENLFWDTQEHFHYLKRIMLKDFEQTLFHKLEILKIKPDYWRNDVEIELTSKGAEFFFGEDARMIYVGGSDSAKKDNIIDAEQIKEKELFYNSSDLPTVRFIHDLLLKDKYLTIKERLKANNMPHGVTILLHGKPGTGKTETVYQIAKQTQRNIFRVEISQLKSMWFGESQKLIKQLFDDYYKYMETQEEVPILFFNEADAVINKRKDSNSSNVAQTENEIQNIILQEMEDFKGILMATTNLIDNIDTAFERRFLFKLELTVPTASTRYEIYRSLLPNLPDNELWILAEDFDFSGGVIQNIVRKATMHHVLNGSYPDISWYVDTCKQEQYKTNNTMSKIGFK